MCVRVCERERDRRKGKERETKEKRERDGEREYMRNLWLHVVVTNGETQVVVDIKIRSIIV